jgi:hypothetical protein
MDNVNMLHARYCNNVEIFIEKPNQGLVLNDIRVLTHNIVYTVIFHDDQI